MSSFLDEVLNKKKNKEQREEDKGALAGLENWSEEFWGKTKEEPKDEFPQAGYEEKGIGHSKQIICNAQELIKNYFQAFIDSHKVEEQGICNKLIYSCKKGLIPTWVLFITSAYLHDIGLNCYCIFKDLSDILGDNRAYPFDLEQYLYEYHHYASFLILFTISPWELNSSREKGGRGTFPLPEVPYLNKIPKKKTGCGSHLIKDLNQKLWNIHNSFFENKTDISFIDFKVILAVLSLRHKNFDTNRVNRLLRDFKEPAVKKVMNPAIEAFDKWMCYFERAAAWTEKVKQRYDDKRIDFSGKESFCGTHKKILDIYLAESLLQYGDKTDITLNRLVRGPGANSKNSNKNAISPLQKFCEALEKDNEVGYFNTELSQKLVTDFARARACLFLPVPLVTVKQLPVADPKSRERELFVFFHYFRFKSDDKLFRQIRFFNEREFFDLDFIKAIRFHLPAVLETLMEVKEGKIDNPIFKIMLKMTECRIDDGRLKDAEDIKDFTENLIKSNFKGIDARSHQYEFLLKGVIELLRKRRTDIGNSNPQESTENCFPYTLQNRSAIKRFFYPYLKILQAKTKKHGSGEVFVDTCDLKVPTNYEIMPVLNLFLKK